MTDEERSPVWDAIVSRKSVRTFDDTPVEREKLERCLDAARLAPSWANEQCWSFVVIEGKEAVDELGIVPARIKNAPALVVACGDPEKSGIIEGKQYYLVDVAVALEHLVLAAWEQGLGSVWVGAIKEDKVRKVLGIPENIKIVALIPLGYPAGNEGARVKLLKKTVASENRKPLKDIVHWGKW